jgi:hypothetical protein
MAIADTALIRYYRKHGADARGRTIDEVRSYSPREFDATHDFIQWLFPLPERSSAVPGSPVLTDTDVATFLGDPMLRRELVESLRCLTSFLGLTLIEDDGFTVVRPGPEFAARSGAWLAPENHNFRRISRAMRSLVVLGCRDYAEALFVCLDGLHHHHADAITDEVFGYWQRAISA